MHRSSIQLSRSSLLRYGLVSGLALGLVGLATFALSAAEPQKGSETKPQAAEKAVDAKWLERLNKDDRTALEQIIGSAPPPFASNLKWFEAKPVMWNDWRGKVVVIQSWTSANAAGRGWPVRFAKSMNQFSADDVRLVALHTPDSADSAEAFLRKQKPPENLTILLDPTGEFCDGLGVYKHPVNVVVDRAGVVRYAGLNPAGLEQAVTALVAEPFDPKAPVHKPQEPASTAKTADFPAITGNVGSAVDVRGKRAPEFAVEEWLTSQPNTAGKVVLVDFWATWCGPCIASIPHMNELATQFSNDVVCIGISDEKRSDFDSGLRKRNLNANSFKYALALDPKSQMSKAIQVRGIPHAIVMSKDWVVRWQGHPARLTKDVMDQIVKANASLPDAPGGAIKRGRWRP